MTQVPPTIHESVKNESAGLRQQSLVQTPIDHIFRRLSRMALSVKENFEHCLRHRWLLNHKLRTLQGSFTLVMLFLDFYEKSGKRDLSEVERVDLEAFVEHEQNRGLRISTVRTRLTCIIAFLHLLMEQDVIPDSLFKRGIKLKLPDLLPRAMNPAGVKKLLSVIDDPRNRVLILLLGGDPRGRRGEHESPRHQKLTDSSQTGPTNYLDRDARKINNANQCISN
jgi:hypothetical protein